MLDKEILYKPSRLKKQLHHLYLRKEEIEIFADSIPGPNYDKPITGGTRNLNAPFIKWLDKIEEINQKIKEVEDDLSKTVESILTYISKISNSDYQDVLILYFINGMSLSQISNKIFVSIKTVKRWKYRAIVEFEKLTPIVPK